MQTFSKDATIIVQFNVIIHKYLTTKCNKWPIRIKISRCVINKLLRKDDSIFHSKLPSVTWCKNRLLVRLWPSWSVRVGSGLSGRRSPRVSGSLGIPPQQSYSSDLLSYTANRKWHHNREPYCRGHLVLGGLNKNQWYEIFQNYTGFTVYMTVFFKLA